jgi:hypothetical protein
VREKTTLLPDKWLQDSIARDGFAFVQATIMHEALVQCGALSDWQRFAASWADLGLDTYMADGGRYRRRRHATYAPPRAARSDVGRINRITRAATTTR